jgi:hypothetical protein
MVTTKQRRHIENTLTLTNRGIYLFIDYDIKNIESGTFILQNSQTISKSAEMIRMINIQILFRKEFKAANKIGLVEPNLPF